MKKVLIIIASLFFVTIYSSATMAYDFSEDIDVTNEEVSTDETADSGEIAQKNGSMYMQGEKLDGDIFKLSILAKDMTVPVLGIAFHLAYEKDKLAFLKYEPGVFLEIGGDPFYLVKNDEKLNKIVYGETLRRDDSFPLGGEKVTDVYFQILSGEQFSFEFKNGVISTLDSVRQDIDLIAWDNFIFGKNASVISDGSIGGASVLASGEQNWSFVWTAAVVLLSAIPISFLIISFIKKHGGMKKIMEIS